MCDTVNGLKQFKRGKETRWDEIHIPNWCEFEKLFQYFSNQWIFRGQRCSNWGLNSSIGRIDNKELNKMVSRESLEDLFLNYVQSQVSTRFKVTLKPSNRLEWLSLIQHYFSITHLLDFTACPYIASFFAFNGVSEKKNTTQKHCSVWAINQQWIKKRAFAKIIKYDQYSNFSFEDIIKPKHFEEIFRTSYLHDKTFVLPLRPTLTKDNFRNKRMKQQKGLFLRQSDPVLSFEDNLIFESRGDYPKQGERKKYIKKFIIPKKGNSNVLKILGKKGIDKKFLFPEKDNFTKECKKILDNWNSRVNKKLESHARESLKRAGIYSKAIN